MIAWNAPGSLLAPLIVGLRDNPTDPGFGNALLAARNSVPATAVTYTFGHRRAPETRMRTLVESTGEEASPYDVRVRLVDVPPGMRPQGVSWASGQWEVGLQYPKVGSAQPAMPEYALLAMLELVGVRMTSAALSGGPQLALLRHLWVRILRSIDPELVVVGGQHDWSDDYWKHPGTQPL